MGMEIEIQPQSSLAGPLEIDIQIGSCAKLILNSSSDEIQEFSDVDVIGLNAKIQTSTVYLLMKNQEAKARSLSLDAGNGSVEASKAISRTSLGDNDELGAEVK